MRRVGLVAGTFDPVHLGHVALARAAATVHGLNEVWLVVNPQFAGQDSFKAGAAPFRQRLEMAKLAVLAESKLRVYEGVRSGYLHSWTSFGELARQEDVQPVFVLGTDAFARLDRWEDVESVVKNATFAVAHRGGGGARELRELRQRLGALAADLRVDEFSFEGFEGVSSSSVKADLRAGVRPAGLDPRVLEYIRAHNLYR